MDRFIALTEFARSRFLAAGFPPEKVVAKPNFVADPGEPATPAGAGENVLFVGRLAPEKGIATMMRAWERLEVPLAVAGDGPLRPLVEASASPYVKALGWKSGAEVAAEMGRCRFMVMPSEWYEGFPMTLVEAFSMGRPVLVSRLGSMAEVVEDGVTGLHVNPGDAADLAAKVRWAYDHPEEIGEMGRNARAGLPGALHGRAQLRHADRRLRAGEPRAAEGRRRGLSPAVRDQVNREPRSGVGRIS